MNLNNIEGRRTIQEFDEEDVLDDLELQKDSNNVMKRIESSHAEFYTQIPFQLVLGDRRVVDLRNREEIFSQATDHVGDGRDFDYWTVTLKIPVEQSDH